MNFNLKDEIIKSIEEVERDKKINIKKLIFNLTGDVARISAINKTLIDILKENNINCSDLIEKSQKYISNELKNIVKDSLDD
jgi:hypothetical protein